jgi:diguanylate cyclase (GGDEF)-like protein
MEDITDRKNAEDQLIRLATHDSLTQLPNRTLLRDRLERAIIQARRHGNMAVVLFIDLDHFKIINDNLGHSVGDQLLTEVGQRLQKTVRESDTVARQGGDEFVILLTDLPDETIINRLALKVFTAFERPFSVAERETEITCSMGISIFPRDGENVETLFQHADIAMFRAKENGRNSYQIYDQEMGRLLLEKTQIQQGLHHAISAGELLLHYQPKVDIHSGEMVGCEALVRWQHPEWGLVPPGKFIDIAEESGLILPLGEWVLQTAIRQVKAWLDAGLCALPVAVNLSARQLLQQDIVLLTQQALLASELDPQYLELEITESMMMKNPDKVIKTLNELKAIGVKLAVDDFGTGYSSLAYLKRFPIDRVKIDREFVKNIASDPDDEAIVSATISMSHHLHYRVVAEGVETREQLEYLRNYGCDEIQGYYFSRPVPQEQFAQLLSAWCHIDTDSLRIESNKKRPRLQIV